ncbi:MAG: hypothetical protein JZU64_09170 [Rhodoferax sp.]|nr:hypothetical protein [Rhodoferax sp.]
MNAWKKWVQAGNLLRQQADAQREAFAEVPDTSLASKADIQTRRADVVRVERRMNGLDAKLDKLQWMVGHRHCSGNRQLRPAVLLIIQSAKRPCDRSFDRLEAEVNSGHRTRKSIPNLLIDALQAVMAHKKKL